MGRYQPTSHVLRDGRRVLIRHAQPTDDAGLGALAASIAEELAFTLLEPDEIPDVRARQPARLRDQLESEDKLRLLAIAPGPAGDDLVVGDIELATGKRRRIAHVARLGIEVHRQWRGAGLGGILMDEALAWGHAHPRIEKVTLNVLAGNAPALALYRSRGFVQEGVHVAQFRLGPGRYSDDLAMAKFVKSGPGIVPARAAP